MQGDQCKHCGSTTHGTPLHPETCETIEASPARPSEPRCAQCDNSEVHDDSHCPSAYSAGASVTFKDLPSEPEVSMEHVAATLRVTSVNDFVRYLQYDLTDAATGEENRAPMREIDEGKLRVCLRSWQMLLIQHERESAELTQLRARCAQLEGRELSDEQCDGIADVVVATVYGQVLGNATAMRERLRRRIRQEATYTARSTPTASEGTK